MTTAINKGICNKKSFDLSKINFFTSGVPVIVFYSIIIIMLALMLIVTFFRSLWKTSYIRIFSIMAVNIIVLVLVFTLYLSISKHVKIKCK